MRISDWSSDVCSSDLAQPIGAPRDGGGDDGQQQVDAQLQPPGDGLPVGSYDQRDTESPGKQPERDDRPAAPEPAGSPFMTADRIGAGRVLQPGLQPALQTRTKFNLFVPAHTE